METNFGIKQVVNKTPAWANIMFQAVIIITFVSTFITSSDPAISDTLKVRIGIYLKAVDLLVLSFSKFFGVQIKEPKENLIKPS